VKTGRSVLLPLLVTAALGVAACSGDDDAAGDTSIATGRPSVTAVDAMTTETDSSGETGASTDLSTPATTSADTAATETTSGDSSATTSTTLVPTTTTVPSGPVYPLTGLPLFGDDPNAFRPALVVKIDNHPEARPQTGLNQADIVFEENVELLTRFAAVFQSQAPDKVGPVRSGRTQDINLLACLNKPMFAWSGGNANVTRAIRASDLIDLSWTVAGNAGGYHRERSPGIHLEHTLYASAALLYQNFTPLYAGPPPAQFTYRHEGEAFNGEASGGAEVAMDGVRVVWTWDAASAKYFRDEDGRPHKDSAGEQINAANVVILEMQYQPSPADRRSPEAQTIGYGPAHILTAGVTIEGTWQRLDRLAPFTLHDTDGNVIALTPGRTWVELAKIGTSITRL
jgi:hypothetical protein